MKLPGPSPRPKQRFLHLFLDPNDRITVSDLQHHEWVQRHYELLMGTSLALGGLGGQFVSSGLERLPSEPAPFLFWVGVVLIAIGIVGTLTVTICDLRTALRREP